MINSIEESEYQTPMLSSLIERCQNSDKIEIQKEWSLWVGNQLNEVASVNPYSEYVEVGEEVSPTGGVCSRGSGSWLCVCPRVVCGLGGNGMCGVNGVCVVPLACDGDLVPEWYVCFTTFLGREAGS